MAKSYQLVAWTDKGKTKMLPEFQNDFLQEYTRRIERAEEDGDLIEIIRAYEKYGDALRECDKKVTALEQYLKAIDNCQCCDDIYWADCDDYGYTITRPFSSHFYRIFGKCRELFREDPRLGKTAVAKELWENYKRINMVSRNIRTELDQAWETFKRWNWHA